MKKMKKLLALLLACSMCLGSAVSVMADDTGSGEYQEQGTDTDSAESTEVNSDSKVSEDITSQDSSNTSSEGNDDISDGTKEDAAGSEEENEYAASPLNRDTDLLGSSSDGTLKTNMLEGEEIFITLADDWNYRWNVNDSGGLNSVVHLDTYLGSNCNFQLYRVKEDGSYTDYYGIRYMGTNRFVDVDGKSTREDAVLHVYANFESDLEDNPHRQFAFYYVKTDENGNDYYYIKNRKSGLWLGYEDKNENNRPDTDEKICQKEAPNRKLWIVTNGVVPKQGGEAEDLIEFKEGSTTEREDGVFVSLFKKDTIQCVTSELDLAADYTNMHFYEMGTNSKMLLVWDKKHSAYEIRYYTDGENYRDKVWDLENEGAKENADVHLWSWQSKSSNENTSQLWRFYEQSDGSYLIQNAKTGKYIAYQYEDTDDPGTLKQLDGAEGSFGDETRKLAYFTIDRIAGTDNPVNFNYSVDWMANIPDDPFLDKYSGNA